MYAKRKQRYLKKHIWQRAAARLMVDDVVIHRGVFHLTIFVGARGAALGRARDLFSYAYKDKRCPCRAVQNIYYSKWILN